MSEEDKKNKNEPKKPVNVKEHVASMKEYEALLESTPDEDKEKFKEALGYYASQWQGIVDALTEAANNKEVSEGFMSELQKRLGQNSKTNN